MKTIKVDCEFGSEVVLKFGEIYNAWKNDKNVKVHTLKGMKPFYFYIKDENLIEEDKKRRLGSPPGTRLHAKELPSYCKEYPNFKEKYSSYKLPFETDREIILISNKYNVEWNKPPINFLDIPTLTELFETLSKKYLVVYNRIQSSQIADDKAEIKDLGDYALVEKYDNVIDFNKIESDYTPNELQLILVSQAKHKISVQGGTSILSSLGGGTNDIFVVKGGELEHDTMNVWYKNLSNSDIKITTHSLYETLIEKFKRI